MHLVLDARRRLQAADRDDGVVAGADLKGVAAMTENLDAARRGSTQTVASLSLTSRSDRTDHEIRHPRAAYELRRTSGFAWPGAALTSGLNPAFGCTLIVTAFGVAP